MTRHVSTENLTRLRDGDLRGGKARRARSHLEHCARCQETSAALGEIPALLAGAQMPQIPAHLAARIETALATESAHRAAGQPSTSQARTGHAGRAADAGRTAGTGRTGPGGRSGHARRAWPRGGLPVPARVLAVAAAVAIVGGGGYEIVTQLGGPVNSAASSSGAEGAARSSAGHASKPDFGMPSANTAFGVPAYGPPVRYQAAGHPAAIRPVRTATNYLPAQLNRQVAASLARVRTLPPAGPLSPGSTGGTSPDAGAFSAARLTQLAGCLDRVAAARTVLLVDLASFRASPATIIVTAGTASAARQVWVVGPGCSRSADDVLAHQSLPGR